MAKQSPSASAAAAIAGSHVAASVTAPGSPPDDLPPVKFDRLSVERRVLGTIDDGLYSDRLGARNNLASISDHLLNDPCTTNPPPPNARLEVEGLSLADAVQKILDMLEALIKAKLVVRKGDLADPTHTYQLTDAGWTELKS